MLSQTDRLTPMLNKHGINPKWVVHTLNLRGLPKLGDIDADRAIKQMSSKQAETFRHVIARLHNGNDTPDDMVVAAAWVREAKALALSLETTDAPASKGDTVDGSAAAPVDSVVVAGSPQMGVAGFKDGQQPSTVLAGKDVVVDPDRQALLHRERQGRERLSHHVYGKEASLCFEPATIVDSVPGQVTPPFNTLMVEIAPAIGDGRYDWSKKIAMRLTRRELPLFYAVCMGWLPEIEFANHGTANDKTLAIKDQKTKLFLRIRQAKRAMGVPIPAEEVFYVAGMALRALQSNMHGLDTQAIAMLAKRAASMHAVNPLEM